MAIIIQDMNMPAQCWQCPFSFRTDNAHTACTRNPIENPVEDGNERPKHCPLKEVKNMFKNSIGENKDLAEKIYWILIEEGQRNLEKSLSSIITNTPDEVRDIVRKHIKELT